MKQILFALVAVLAISSCACSIFSFPSLDKLLGDLDYPVELHDITTEDGYILTFFRVQAKGSEIQSGLPVVYLQHGLLNSADTWITNDEDNAPGTALANKGYDVWIGNVRGTKYSLKHTSMTSKDDAFWQFSWQNYSSYDLPAALEYIHDQTGELINYVGHSQGTLMMFAALSERNPKVTQYLRKFVALAPVAWVSHINSGVVKMIAYSPILKIYEAFDKDRFFPANFLEDESFHVVCKVVPGLCGDFLGLAFGFDKQYDNYNRYNIMLEYEPGGCSVMNMAHWKQMVLTQTFGKFDYGTDGNILHYGEPTAPLYDVSNINFPVHLFFGQDDDLVDPRDTQTLLDNLTGTKVEYKEYPSAHMTFLWSKDISFYFDDLLETLEGPADTIVE